MIQFRKLLRSLQRKGLLHFVNTFQLTHTSKQLTCCRTWSIYHALTKVVSLHPSLNLLRFDFLTSHTEPETTLICIDKAPLLAMSYDGLHLFWFDILIQLPLSQMRSILTNPVQLISLVMMQRWRACPTQQRIQFLVQSCFLLQEAAVFP